MIETFAIWFCSDVFQNDTIDVHQALIIVDSIAAHSRLTADLIRPFVSNFGKTHSICHFTEK
jgi:hypothetical protein